MPDESRKVLVTGGAGFIGGHVAEAYLQRGDRVWIVDDLSSGKRDNIPPAATFIHADIADRDVRALIAYERFSLINHHAAQISVCRSTADPVTDARTNVLGLLNILEGAREAGTKRVIFVSSGGAVYGQARQLPTPENAPKMPASPYGVAKLAGEQYLQYYQLVHGLEYAALRYGNVYGPRQDPAGETGVIAIFAARLLHGQPLVIYGDGEQTRDFIHVQDVVGANMTVSDVQAPAGTSLDARAFNVGTGVATCLNQLAEVLETASGVAKGREHRSERPGELRHSVLSPAKLRELGWTPRLDLATGLRQTFDYIANLHSPG